VTLTADSLLSLTKLKQNKPRESTYQRGKDTSHALIVAARDVFTSQGYATLSIRKVAERAGVSVGNLTYHFPNKQCLIEAMFEFVLNDYLMEFDRLSQKEGPAQEQLRNVVGYIFNDLANPTTTVLFPELWALANHEQYAAKVLDEIYRKARAIFVNLIPKINPSLSTQQVEDIALFMSASVEGHTMFVGANKQFTNSNERLTLMAQSSFLAIIKNTAGIK